MRDISIPARSTLGLTLTTRIIAPMAAMIVLAIALVLAFVVFSARQQNQLEVQASTKLAETALAVNERQLARNLKDYAVWEDVYRNLHMAMNFDWAATDGNVGANIFEGLLYEMAFVVRPEGNTVYAVLEGVPQTGDAFKFLPHGLGKLIEASRQDTAPAVGLLRSGQDIFMVAATTILPPSISASTLPVSERSTIIFANKLDKEFLDRVSSEYLLEDLEIVPNGDPAGAAIELPGSDGTSLGQLRWSPKQPGFELLRLLLPPLALAILVLSAFAWLVVHNTRTSAFALQESAQTVQAFAQTLQDSEARFRDVAEASSDWIWECDPEKRLIYMSGRFSEVTGLSAASVLGKTLEQFFSSEEKHENWTQWLGSSPISASFRDLRCSYMDSAGHHRICRLAGRPILDPSGTITGYRGTATDITDEVEAQARANYLALHDSLTQLPNRVLFRDRMHVALQGICNGSNAVAVLCLDLDHFKEVNDTLGHAAGDLLLTQLAGRLRACLRPTDTVARLGGDEFAVIQVGNDQPSNATSLSERIIEIVKQPFLIEGQELHIGVSVGVALSGDATHTPDHLLKNADIALYRAKQAGRGTYRFFEIAMDEELRVRKALEQDLRQAVSKGELVLHYQPLIDLRTQRVTVVEALLRWQHPTRGLVTPIEFIPIAEETGMIVAIGEWVLRTACEQVKSWPGVRVAVNLSPVQFRSQEIVETVETILSATGLDPSRLELEITESVLIKDAQNALIILKQLKEVGVQIAMDDFGTGYSSLGYLNTFPFDKIKIDRSFISSLSTDDKSNAIVRSVIGLGASLGMTTTAEGVETWEQAAFLHQEGCGQVQGFYFGRPMPSADIMRFLEHFEAVSQPSQSEDAA